MIPCIDADDFWRQVKRGTIRMCSSDTANVCTKTGGITVYGCIVKL